MSNELFKVPKIQRQVTLWVHPEGRVVGSMFLMAQSANHAGQEEPIEALNHDIPFIALCFDNPSQLRLYNRSSIIRLEYELTKDDKQNTNSPLNCEVHMMDGSIIPGSINEPLPPDRSRLFDYLNLENERFIKLYTSDDEICLINKSYINYVTTEDDATCK